MQCYWTGVCYWHGREECLFDFVGEQQGPPGRRGQQDRRWHWFGKHRRLADGTFVCEYRTGRRWSREAEKLAHVARVAQTVPPRHRTRTSDHTYNLDYGERVGQACFVCGRVLEHVATPQEWEEYQALRGRRGTQGHIAWYDTTKTRRPRFRRGAGWQWEGLHVMVDGTLRCRYRTVLKKWKRAQVKDGCVRCGRPVRCNSDMIGNNATVTSRKEPENA
jgi:hypothetical protein